MCALVILVYRILDSVCQVFYLIIIASVIYNWCKLADRSLKTGKSGMGLINSD